MTEVSETENDQSEGPPLNPRQIRFAQEYVIDLNATQAYIRAGYEVSSNDIAGASGARLLADARVKRLVARLQADKAKRLEIDADKVLSQISRLAFSDVRQIFTGCDGLKNIASLDEDTAAAIQSVKVTKKPAGKNEDGGMEYDDVVEYKLADKKGPLEMLAKHLGELTENVNINHTGELKAIDKEMTLEEATRIYQDNIRSVSGSES